LECGGQPPLWDHVGAIICAKIYVVLYKVHRRAAEKRSLEEAADNRPGREAGIFEQL
jgi:hypothetical protein